MTCDLDIWHVGSSSHFVGQVQKSRSLEARCYEVVSMTLSEGFLVFLSDCVCVLY